jgi:hypothetical protein
MDDKALRDHVLVLLRGGNAHATFGDAVGKFPVALRGKRHTKVPYSAWQLVEHIRIAQRDILDFTRLARGEYVAPAWPDGYWPKKPKPPTEQAWDDAIDAVNADAKAFARLVARGDLFARVPSASKKTQTLLRNALLLADHNAYHTGELILLRRLLGAWR